MVEAGDLSSGTGLRIRHKMVPALAGLRPSQFGMLFFDELLASTTLIDRFTPFHKEERIAVQGGESGFPHDRGFDQVGVGR